MNESKVPREYEICDNVELNNILQDYETYYFIRFQKYPKISKRNSSSSEALEKRNVTKPKKALVKEQKKDLPKDLTELTITSTALSVIPIGCDSNNLNGQGVPFEDKLFRPLGSFDGYSDEWKAMADVISKVPSCSLFICRNSRNLTMSSEFSYK